MIWANALQPPDSEGSGGALVATNEGVVLPDGSEVTGPIESVGGILLQFVAEANEIDQQRTNPCRGALPRLSSFLAADSPATFGQRVLSGDARHKTGGDQQVVCSLS